MQDLLIGEHTYQYYDPAFQHIKDNWKNPEEVKIFHNHYTTTKVSNYAHGYLEKALKHDEPFFVGIAPVTPHVQTGKDSRPPVPEKKYQGTLPVTVPPADNFNPANVSCGPIFLEFACQIDGQLLLRIVADCSQRSGVNLVWKLNKLSTDQENQLHYHYQCRSEALLSVDDMVERVVKTLENAGQLNNTYIIYTSDNGFHLGHHRLGAGKKYAFEEDINVPLIIRGPGVPKGRTTNIVSAHVDLAPTILKMAGIRQRADFDGKPIAHTAAAIEKQEGAAADEHANIEFWVGANYGWANLPQTQAGRRKRMKVNSYKSVRLTGQDYDIMYAVQCKNNSHELYNMNKDPVQMRNLHPTAPHEKGHKNAFHSGEGHIADYEIKRLLPRIDALLLVLKSCTREACSNPWKQLHPNGKVHNLKHAMHHNFDHYYIGLPKVHFRKCFKNGKINLWAEGPQWRPGLANGNEQFEIDVSGTESLQVTIGPKEDDYIDVGWNELQDDAGEDDVETDDSLDELGNEDDDDLSAVDWERQGYLDDWE